MFWLEVEVLCATFLLKFLSTKSRADLKSALNRGNGGSIFIALCVCIYVYASGTFFCSIMLNVFCRYMHNCLTPDRTCYLICIFCKEPSKW